MPFDLAQVHDHIISTLLACIWRRLLAHSITGFIFSKFEPALFQHVTITCSIPHAAMSRKDSQTPLNS